MRVILKYLAIKTCILENLCYTICMVWEKYNLLVRKAERTILSRTIALLFLWSNICRAMINKPSSFRGKPCKEGTPTIIDKQSYDRVTGLSVQ